MKRFADLPIKSKLVSVITGTSVFALALACAGFVTYEIVTYRAEAGRDLSLRAEILAASGAVALTFADERAAQETLDIMRVDPHSISAQFYAKNGTLFAAYARDGALGDAPESPEPDGHLYSWDRQTVVRPILLSGRRIGTVRLTRDLVEMRRALLAVLSLTVLLLIASSLAAFAIAARAQRMISEPILDLTRTAQAISERQDFSARAGARGEDELGILVRTFNEMLDQIEKRDAALRNSRSELIRSEARYRALLRGVPDVLFRFSADGVYLDYEVSDPKLLPFPPEAFLGKNVRDVVPAEFAEHCLQGIERASRTGERQLSECELPSPDGGKRFLEVRFVALEDGDVLAVVRDVTERKLAQDELRKLTAQLEKRVEERTAELTALNKELEAFSYSVSHDLRAPLRAISGYSSLLLERTSGRLDAQSRSYLERTAAAAGRMAEIIDDLLNLSRVTRAALEPDVVDLSALARAVADDMRALASGRSVAVAIDEGALVRGDAKLLRILLENLFSNAWKFTSRTLAPRVEFRVRREGGRPVFTVRDNGAGFDPAYIDKLFKPFSRLHSQADYGGTGVGLVTVARIVERHGGRVWAEGAVDRGASFHFTLPEAGEDHGSKDDTAR